MHEEQTSGAQWRPILVTDKATGRSVHITIFDREMFLSGLFNFDDLYEMYNDENDMYNNNDDKTQQ
jgi:hypothetical protein